MSSKRTILLEKFDLSNRRYMGNKTKLIPFIKEIVYEKCEIIYTMCDIFAGTGSVSHAFNTPHTKIISNDMLTSNYFGLHTFLSSDNRILDSIYEKIEYLNSLEPHSDNYFSKRYGGTFFTTYNARKIGLIRDKINKISKNNNELRILVTSLLYALDKVANTVGHYDAYRKSLDSVKPIKLLVPNLKNISINHNNTVLCDDANHLIKNIKVDVLYLDPPYNSRQYCDAYHLLENVATYTKLPTFGKAHKFNRDHLKSKYCGCNAVAAFNDLIKNAKAKHIFLSYNNTSNSRDDRSNAKITDKQIKQILRNKGKLEIFETKYPEFFTGKAIGNNEHTERLFYCEVK